MKRQLIAIGVAGVFPLIGVAVVVIATAVDAAALGIHRLIHR
ncbi:hypothetical protein [Actinoplanes sp. GCM10030250]